MKVVIFAGGYGSRLGSITQSIPKPMVEIGEKPILWHIMKIYSHFGFNEFVILLGYKGKNIKEYFLPYSVLNNTFTVNLATGKIITHNEKKEDFTTTLVDTGVETLKGGRLKQAEAFLDSDINFLTYGDGVANIDMKSLLSFHQSHGKTLTVTGVCPPSRFGELNVQGEQVISFEEKPQTSQGIINGGFMVFNQNLFDYLKPDRDCDLEFGALETLAKKGEIMVFKHPGSWACIDTERDLKFLNKLWKENKAFWKVWEE